MARIKQRSCDFCGTPYTGRGDSYCSTTCRDKARRGYTIVALPDVHLEHCRPPHESYLAVKSFASEIKPDIVIILGDFLELPCFNHHNRKKARLFEGKRFALDVDLARRELDFWLSVSGRVAYIEGNHELWAQRFVEEVPQMEGVVDLPRQLRLDELGISWTPHGQILSVGRVNFTHGWSASKYCAAAHLQEVGDHLFFGHTHTLQVHAARVGAGREPYIAASIGCLCDRNPHYLRGKPNRWVNAFAVIEVMPDGTFTPIIPTIVNGQFVYSGQIFKASAFKS